jgi:ubiquitin C-terminal hydrolase
MHNRKKSKEKKPFTIQESGDQLIIRNKKLKTIILLGQECRLDIPESWEKKVSIKTLFIYFVSGSFLGTSAVLIVALIFYMMGMFVFVNPIN